MDEYVRDVICRSQENAGYSVNVHGGNFRNGIARPLEDKIRVAQAYADMMGRDSTTSVNAVAKEAKVSRAFVSKVIGEVHSGLLIDPRTAVKQHPARRGAGAKTISDEDGLILLAMRAENNRRTLANYSLGLYNATGNYVSKSVICKWFLSQHVFKGGLRVLDKVPIDKYSPDNCLRLMEYLDLIVQINPMRLKFCDEKHLKGQEQFSNKGWMDPLTGTVEPIYVPSDFCNAYTIIGVCGVAPETIPFDFVLHEGMNDAEMFSNVILCMVADGTLVSGDVLVMDNAAIHHYKESADLEDILWNNFEIAIVFLPTRAPELNPIELLWHTLVRRMQSIELSGTVLQQGQLAAQAAAAIMNDFTHDDVVSCYRKCNYFC